MYKRFVSEFLLGAVAGAILAWLLLPDPLTRLMSLLIRLDSIPAVNQSRSGAERELLRLRLALRHRYDLALQESQGTIEDTRRDLWQRFEAARRGQRLPGA